MTSKRAAVQRVAATIGALPILLSSVGCLSENSLDMAVFFNNTTDDTLFLLRRDLSEVSDGEQIGPSRVTSLMLLAKGDCSSQWVITDRSGQVIKDPGRVCWHDTIAIP